jgi:hypothetical protein
VAASFAQQALETYRAKGIIPSTAEAETAPGPTACRRLPIATPRPITATRRAFRGPARRMNISARDCCVCRDCKSRVDVPPCLCRWNDSSGIRSSSGRSTTGGTFGGPDDSVWQIPISRSLGKADPRLHWLDGPVAQSAEQGTSNPTDAGSSVAGATRVMPASHRVFRRPLLDTAEPQAVLEAWRMGESGGG